MDSTTGARPKVGRPLCKARTYFHEVQEFDRKLNKDVIKWKCNYCEMKYGEKTGTANFTRHLKKSHNIVWDESGQIVSNASNPDLENKNRPTSNPDLENMGYNGVPLSSQQPVYATTPHTTIGQQAANYLYSPPSIGQYSPATPAYPYHHSSPMPEQQMATSPDQSSSGSSSSFEFVYRQQCSPSSEVQNTISPTQQQFTHPSVGQYPGSSLMPDTQLQIGQSVFQHNSLNSGQMFQESLVSSNQSNYNHQTRNSTNAEQIISNDFVPIQQNFIPPSTEFGHVPVPQYSDSLSLVVQNTVENNDIQLHIPDNSLDDWVRNFDNMYGNNVTQVNESVSSVADDQLMETCADWSTSTVEVMPNIDDKLMNENVATDVKYVNGRLNNESLTSSNLSIPENCNTESTVTQRSSRTKDSLMGKENKSQNDVEIADILDNLNSEDKNQNLVKKRLIVSSQHKIDNYFLPNESKKKEEEQQIVLSRKRRQHELEIELIEGLDYVYEQLLNKGYNKTEVQYKMIEMAVNSPMHLDSFLRPNVQDFFSIAHPTFPVLNLRSIDNQMLGRRRKALVAIIQDQYNTKWSPFLFDVFLFPLTLGQGEKYVMVELAYLDKHSRRRSCPLDCLPIPKYSKGMQVLKDIVMEKIRDFGVEFKIADFNTWGTELQELQTLLRKTALNKGRQRALAFKENKEEVTKEYFSTLKKKREDFFISIQMEVAQTLFVLDQIENVLQSCIAGLTTETGQAAWSTDRLEIVSRRFRVIGTKFKELEDFCGTIKKKLFYTSRDKKYAVYYSQKNNPVNLLQIVPLHSYERLLKDLSCYIGNFLKFLQNPEMETKNTIFNLSDMSDELLLIDMEDTINIPQMNLNELFKMLLDAALLWRNILYRGVKMTEEYTHLCKYFTGYKSQSNVQSRYVEEFVGVAISAPPDMSPEEWKKAAFVRAWEQFEKDSYS